MAENQGPNEQESGRSYDEIIVGEGTTTMTITAADPPFAPNASAAAESSDSPKSALRDNIDKKGKNAYYFAHAHRATGPDWDGKQQPRLLGRESSSDLTANGAAGSKVTGVEYHKSNITNYAFLDECDEKRRVKIYVHLPGVGGCCTNDDDVRLEFTELSLCLTVVNYNPSLDDELDQAAVDSKGQGRCLSFSKLFGRIESASFRKRVDKIVVTLVKKDDNEWTSVKHETA